MGVGNFIRYGKYRISRVVLPIILCILVIPSFGYEKFSSANNCLIRSSYELNDSIVFKLISNNTISKRGLKEIKNDTTKYTLKDSLYSVYSKFENIKLKYYELCFIKLIQNGKFECNTNKFLHFFKQDLLDADNILVRNIAEICFNQPRVSEQRISTSSFLDSLFANYYLIPQTQFVYSILFNLKEDDILSLIDSLFEFKNRNEKSNVLGLIAASIYRYALLNNNNFSVELVAKIKSSKQPEVIKDYQLNLYINLYLFINHITILDLDIIRDFKNFLLWGNIDLCKIRLGLVSGDLFGGVMGQGP